MFQQLKLTDCIIELALPQQAMAAMSAQQIQQWLAQVPAFSQFKLEFGVDWWQLRCYFNAAIVNMHYEHYTDCYWIDTDSPNAVVVMSELAVVLENLIALNSVS